MASHFQCEACGIATLATHDPELVLCADCHVEALLSDAADAVNAANDRIDVEAWALADAAHGERWLA